MLLMLLLLAARGLQLLGDRLFSSGRCFRRPGRSDLRSPLLPRVKPSWVRREVIRLAVHLRSCRAVAQTFNAIHGRKVSVGKTFVHEVCRVHAREIEALRRAMRSTPPRAIEVGREWAVDLTQIAGASGPMHVLGLIDQGSRRVLRLDILAQQCAWTLLGHLCLAIARFGKPAVLRSDNGGAFSSRVWRQVLQSFGIVHRRTRPHCPWQNGRIERLFGTLKSAFAGLRFGADAALDKALREFTVFYNEVRPHQNLGGLTRSQVWRGITHSDLRREAGNGQWVQALGGRLVGYWLRC